MSGAVRTDDAQGMELCTQVVADEHTVDFQVHKVVADVHKVQVARCAASMGLVASSVSLLRRLIFLTVVYGRTAVRRRKVDGKICFPAACQKLDEGGKQNWDCQGLDNKIPAGNWRRSSCLSNPVWSVCGYLPSLFYIDPTFDSLK